MTLTLPRLCAILMGVLLALQAVRAGDAPPEPQTMESFVKALLREQPRFRVNGIFTSKEPGKPAVVCGARIRFDKDVGAVFSYNTSGEDLEPYDFYYWKRSLALFVYDRNRQNVVKSEMLGAPLRPVFNFVWDLVDESGGEPGMKSLLFSGLMRMSYEETGDTITVSFGKKIVPLPIRELTFIFGKDYQLQSLSLIEGDGSSHSFQVLQFQKTNEKLRKPKIQKKPVERH